MTSPLPAVPALLPSPDRLLSRELGVRQLAAIIFNSTVGSGIFVLPALAAIDLGAAALFAYLVCAIVMALMVMCFAEAGSRVSATGGPYAYVEAALGPLVGFLAGVLLLVSSLSAAAAVARVFAGSVGTLAGTTSISAQGVLILFVLAAVAAINIQGVRKGALLVEIFVAAKIVPLIGFVIVGAAFVRPEHLQWTSTPSASSVISTAGVLIFAFIGIEGALQPSGEVRNVARTVPRAAFLAIGAATMLYVAIQVIAQGVLGSALAEDRVAPLAAAAAFMFGRPGRIIMLVGAVISMFGYLCGTVLAGPRGLFAFARDGLAPRWLASVHKSHHTPHVSIIAYVVIAFMLALSGSFERLAIVSNVASLLVYFGCAISVLVLRRRDVRADGDPFHAPGGPIVPVLACASISWLLVETTTRVELAAVGLTLVVALIVYALRSRQRYSAGATPLV